MAQVGTTPLEPFLLLRLAGVATRGLTLVHRYLGIGVALLFLMWFSSGIVLYFVPFPQLSPAERFAGMPPIQSTTALVSPAEALRALGIAKAGLVRLAQRDDQPVYRVLPEEGRWQAVSARDGKALADISDAIAIRLARAFARQSGWPQESWDGSKAAQVMGRFAVDQWTVSAALDPHRPLVEVALNDAAGTNLYLSAATGEIVRDTRRLERFANWIGAIPHWIYPVQLRKYPDTWHHVVVWLALPGVIAALTGIWLGVARLRLRPLGTPRAVSPYRRFWMRWHHLLGLGCSLFILTYIISGLLSMNPFGVFPPRLPHTDESARYTGAMLDQHHLNQAWPTPGAPMQGSPGPREIEWRMTGGMPLVWMRFSLTQSLLVERSAAQPAERAALDLDVVQARLQHAAAHARSPVTLTEAQRLDQYDDYYYARDAASGHRPLPVLRLRFADGVVWYLDLASGTIMLKSDPRNRVQRWLYNSLHTLDFEALRSRPWLHATLVVSLNFLGAIFSVTSVVIAYQRLLRSRHKSVSPDARGLLTRQTRRLRLPTPQT